MTRSTFAIVLIGLLVISAGTGATAASADKSFAEISKSKAARFPRNKQIVVGSSIGGVQLGQSKRAARSAWSGVTACTRPAGSNGTCVWATKVAVRYGGARFEFYDDKVISVSITTGLNNRYDQKPIFIGPLTKLHTIEGIKLGSSLDSVRGAYPGGDAVENVKPSGNGTYVYSYMLNAPTSRTNFTFSTDGRLTGIEIYAVNTAPADPPQQDPPPPSE